MIKTILLNASKSEGTSRWNNAYSEAPIKRAGDYMENLIGARVLLLV